MSGDENWEQEYPEDSLGWKINRKLDAIKEHALKSGAVFMLLFVTFFTPAVIEIALYWKTLPNSSGPFFVWRLSQESLALAQWHVVIYVVVLLMFACAFLYFSVRLLWRGLKTR